MSVENQTALYLLEAGAIKLSPDNPYTWASGWKSPIYCDNRLTLSFPIIRNYIKEQLTSAIKSHFPTVESLAGVATAGIPQAALVADRMSLPMLYVRSKPKGHGLENLIEGKVSQGQKVVVVEDLISTGGSSLSAAQALQKEGFQVLGLVAIFTYGFPQSVQAFNEAKIPFYTLTNYETLLEVAIEMGVIQMNKFPLLQDWRKNPSTWESSK
jgi:orotate phosphoribosyltransferase